jgi:RNA polymerase sigma-70 factor (ECF subfamily)
MTDDQLIQAFMSSGDATAIDTLVNRHLGRIRAMIYGMVLNDADADDLTQEAFLKAIASLPRFKGRSSFATWLYRIAMNVTRSFIRKRSRSPLGLSDDCREEPDPAPAPADKAMAREEEAILRRSLAGLPIRLRSAFSLVVLEGVDPREAARIEGCFLSTIYRRVHAARRKLAQTLGDGA